MGPRSKEAVVSALGNIIDEQLQQRHLLQRILANLEAKAEHDRDDLRQVNKRVTLLERELRILLGASPAE